MPDETPQQPAAPAPSAPDEATQRMIDGWLALTRGALSYELDDAGVAAVRAGAARLLGNAAKLRAYPLVNADEPDFIFRPYRAEG
jgi:hypothetical protein